MGKLERLVRDKEVLTMVYGQSFYTDGGGNDGASRSKRLHQLVLNSSANSQGTNEDVARAVLRHQIFSEAAQNDARIADRKVFSAGSNDLQSSCWILLEDLGHHRGRKPFNGILIGPGTHRTDKQQARIVRHRPI